jgi:hypothetical protein
MVDFRGRNVPLKSFHTEALVAKMVPMLIVEWDSKGCTSWEGSCGLVRT